MELEKSGTKANLQSAFAGEAQAGIRYRYYARLCKRAGEPRLAAIFEETASNELAHACRWFFALREEKLPEIDRALLLAAGGERYEWSGLYHAFAEKAAEEGFFLPAHRFRLAAETERMEGERFFRLANEAPFGGKRKMMEA